MYHTPWIEQEDKSYWESLLSIHENLPPIIRARAVKLTNNKYWSVIRDFTTGKMIALNHKGTMQGYSSEYAKRKCIELVYLTIYDNAGWCRHVEQNICPHYKCDETEPSTRICNKCLIRINM